MYGKKIYVKLLIILFAFSFGVGITNASQLNCSTNISKTNYSSLGTELYGKVIDLGKLVIEKYGNTQEKMTRIFGVIDKVKNEGTLNQKQLGVLELLSNYLKCNSDFTINTTSTVDRGNSNGQDTSENNIERKIKTFHQPKYKGEFLGIGSNSYGVKWCKENFDKNSNFAYIESGYYNSSYKPYYYYTNNGYGYAPKGSSLGSTVNNIVCGVGFTDAEKVSKKALYTKNRITRGGTYKTEDIKKKLNGRLLDGSGRDQAENFCKKLGYQDVEYYEKGRVNAERTYIYNGGKTENLNANCTQFECITRIACGTTSGNQETRKTMYENVVNGFNITGSNTSEAGNVTKKTNIIKFPKYKGLPLWIGADSYAVKYCKDNGYPNTTESYRVVLETPSNLKGKPFYWYTSDSGYGYSKGLQMSYSTIGSIICSEGYTKDELKVIGDKEKGKSEYSITNNIKTTIGIEITNLTANNTNYKLQFKCLLDGKCYKWNGIQTDIIRVTNSNDVKVKNNAGGWSLLKFGETKSLQWPKGGGVTATFSNNITDKQWSTWVNNKNWSWQKINGEYVCQQWERLGNTKINVSDSLCTANKPEITLKQVKITGLLERYNGTNYNGNSYICDISTGYCTVDGGAKNGIRSSWFTVDGRWLTIHLKNNNSNPSFDVTESCGQTMGWYGPMKSGADVKFKVNCVY